MTAIPLREDDGGFGVRDPAIEIMTRIERARARTRRQRSAPATYALFEAGR